MISPAAVSHSGGAFVAHAPATAPVAAAKLRMLPSANFVYVYHPRRWDVVEVDGEYSLVPILNEFRFEAGVGGVQHVRGHAEGDATAALAFEAARGGIVLNPKMTVKAWDRDVEGYARSYDGYRGRVHLSVWHRPYVLGDDHVVEHDTVGYNRWRRSLVVDGVVPAPDPTVVSAMRVRFEKTRSRYAAAETIASLANAEKYEARLQALLPGLTNKSVRASAPTATAAPTTVQEDRIDRLEITVASLTDVLKQLTAHVQNLAPPVAPPAPPDSKPPIVEPGDKPVDSKPPPKRAPKAQD
jgi:hypothetical protein